MDASKPPRNDLRGRSVTSSMTRDPSGLICRAIRERRLLELLYKGSRRLVEPHQYGIDRRGRLVLNAWQLSGGNGRHWGNFFADDIVGAKLTDRRFRPRRDYHPEGYPLDRTLCRLQAQVRYRGSS